MALTCTELAQSDMGPLQYKLRRLSCLCRRGVDLLAPLRPKVLRQSYDGIVGEVLSERDAAVSRAAFLFVPLCPPSGRGAENVQAHAAELVSKVTGSDVALIDRTVDNEWSETLTRLPDHLRDAVESRHAAGQVYSAAGSGCRGGVLTL